MSGSTSPLLQRRVKRTALAALLAPTLGEEKSQEVVELACLTLDLNAVDNLRSDQALAILDLLAECPGIVGVVARFVKLRGELAGLTRRESSAPPPNTSRPAALAPPKSTTLPSPRHRAEAPVARAPGPDLKTPDLLAFLAPSLGEEKGLEAIAAYAAKIEVSGPTYTRAEALRMFELMAQAEGMLGVVARFVRARFILKFPL